MAVLFDATGSNSSVPSAGADRPIITDWVEQDLDLDAVGQILLYQFPPVAFLPNRAGSISLFYVDDADTGATYSAGLDISGSDGVGDVELAATATKGRTAGDSLDMAVVEGVADGSEGAWIDVGGKYVTLDITAVGTNTACTTQLRVEYSQNVIKKAQVAS